MYVVHARPIDANVKPMSTAAGTASSAHHDGTSPNSSIVNRNTVEYIAPRINADAISPVAMSPAPTGVATTASYVCEYLYFTKKLNVVSSSAPFIAADASRPGATNCLYETSSPPKLIDPTRL